MRKNLLFFLSKPALANLYESWVVKFLAAEVGWVFHVDTPESLEEITRNSKGKWDIIVTDTTQSEAYTKTIHSFIGDNPGVITAVMYDSGAKFPANTPFKNALMFIVPTDIDEWLVMMRQLLNPTPMNKVT